MDLGRRQVVQTGAAAAAVAPFLQSMPATAAMDKSAKAPVITIFDHRGCKRGGPDGEYKGLKANGPDDEMCVKVQSSKITVSEAEAAKALQEFISFTSKGLDGAFKGPKAF
jgi:hypothetical protein